MSATLPTGWLRVELALAACLLLTAAVLRRAEPAALAAPFLLAAAVAAVGPRPPRVEAEIEAEPLRLVEGERVAVAVTLRAAAAAAWVEVALPAAAELRGEGRRRIVHLAAAASRRVEFEFEAAGFGGCAAGPAELVVRDRWGLFCSSDRAGRPVPLRIYPRGAALPPVPLPRMTAPSVGSTVARVRGPGIEFADVREYLPGDRMADVNWRVSARRGELHVNQHHPERNSDVVVFLDSFGDPHGWGAPLLRAGIEAAAALTSAYLRRRDRVGLVGFGGVVRWVLPGAGRAQEQRLVDTLIDTRIATSYAWRDLEVIPARTLPPRALVIAVTPLLDERATAALTDLRGRGFDLALLDVGPERFVAEPRAGLPRLAYRLWKMRRDQIRAELAGSGVAVATWRAGQGLDAAVAELAEMRRWVRTPAR